MDRPRLPTRINRHSIRAFVEADSQYLSMLEAAGKNVAHAVLDRQDDIKALSRTLSFEDSKQFAVLYSEELAALRAGRIAEAEKLADHATQQYAAAEAANRAAKAAAEAKRAAPAHDHTPRIIQIVVFFAVLLSLLAWLKPIRFS